MEETVSTLRFATRVKTLTTNINITQRNDPTLLLRKYERQINELKMELAMRDTLSGRNISYEDLGDLEKTELMQMVKKYIAGEIALEDVEINNMKQIKETYNQFKLVHQALQIELQNQVAIAKESAGKDGGEEGETGDVANNEVTDDMVGDADMEMHSFQVGKAPGHLRPEVDEIEQPEEGSLSPWRSPSKVKPGEMDDKHTAFEAYKRSHKSGSELSSSLKSMTSETKDKKKKIKELAMQTNDCKKAIDGYTATLQAMKESGATAEEQELALTLKKSKAEYRVAFGELKELKDAIVTLEESINSTRVKLMDGFEAWYAGKNQQGSPIRMSPMKAGEPNEEQVEEFDQEEKFERMNMERIILTDPDSAAFFGARKALRGKTGPALFHGDKGRATLNRKLEVNQAR